MKHLYKLQQKFGDFPVLYNKHGDIIGLSLSSLGVSNEDLQLVGRITSLKVLDLAEGNISDLLGLRDLINLERLNLRKNQIIKTDGIENLTNLEMLSLRINRIEKIKNFEKLTKLKDIDFGFNLIRKIEGLDSLQNLERLNLSCNRITVIENLFLLKLQSVGLFHNPIVGVRGFANLSRNVQELILNKYLKYLKNGYL